MRRAPLLDAIDISTPAGLRDRALIGLMVYTWFGCTRKAASSMKCPARYRRAVAAHDGSATLGAARQLAALDGP
jgi:uncharacterized protein YfaQ (DUF2300 family)